MASDSANPSREKMMQKRYLADYLKNKAKIGQKAAKLSASKLDDAVAALDRLTGSASLVQAAEFYDRYHGIVPVDDAVAALNVLEGGATLLRAAEFYVKHVGSASRTLTVQQAVDKYIADSGKNRLRESSMQDLRTRLGRFCESFGDALMTDVTRREVREWLSDLTSRTGNSLAPLSRKHFKVVCGGLFN
jgi:hypothetical protein